MASANGNKQEGLQWTIIGLDNPKWQDNVAKSLAQTMNLSKYGLNDEKFAELVFKLFGLHTKPTKIDELDNNETDEIDDELYDAMCEKLVGPTWNFKDEYPQLHPDFDENDIWLWKNLVDNSPLAVSKNKKWEQLADEYINAKNNDRYPTRDLDKKEKCLYDTYFYRKNYLER